ncbi:MAG: class I SAM-dependent methyltransferase [Anaerolineales bacterium]
MDSYENPEIIERKQGVAGIFGRASPTYDRIGPRFFSHFARRLVALAQIPSGATVLDVATGRGAVLFSAAGVVGPQGHVTGIDLSEGMVRENQEEIKQLGLQNVEVRQMDAEYLEFPDASFDRVLCGFAIFFFPQLDRALSEMRRVLKADGWIAVTTWESSFSEQWKWFDELVETYLPPEPETKQTSDPQSAPKPVFDKPEGLEAILNSGGFADIKVVSESEEFLYTDEEEWWSALWSHGARADLEAIQKKTGVDGLERFKADVLERMRTIKQADGIHQSFPVLFASAIKPEV